MGQLANPKAIAQGGADELPRNSPVAGVLGIVFQKRFQIPKDKRGNHR